MLCQSIDAPTNILTERRRHRQPNGLGSSEADLLNGVGCNLSMN
jgi:hypothetical protein